MIIFCYWQNLFLLRLVLQVTRASEGMRHWFRAPDGGFGSDGGKMDSCCVRVLTAKEGGFCLHQTEKVWDKGF